MKWIFLCMLGTVLDVSKGFDDIPEADVVIRCNVGSHLSYKVSGILIRDLKADERRQYPWAKGNFHMVETFCAPLKDQATSLILNENANPSWAFEKSLEVSQRPKLVYTRDLIIPSLNQKLSIVKRVQGFYGQMNYRGLKENILVEDFANIDNLYEECSFFDCNPREFTKLSIFSMSQTAKVRENGSFRSELEIILTDMKHSLDKISKDIEQIATKL